MVHIDFNKDEAKMDEQSMMQNSGQYEPNMIVSQPQVDEMTSGQKEIMASLFGKYYKQAGRAVMYMKTDNGQKIMSTALLMIVLAVITKNANKKR